MRRSKIFRELYIKKNSFPGTIGWIWSDMSQVYLGSCVQLYSLAETPQLRPPPAFGLIYEGAIGQPIKFYSIIFYSILCDPLPGTFR